MNAFERRVRAALASTPRVLDFDLDGKLRLAARVAELLENMTGVCQDFTHFMVSGLRSLGLQRRTRHRARSFDQFAV